MCSIKIKIKANMQAKNNATGLMSIRKNELYRYNFMEQDVIFYDVHTYKKISSELKFEHLYCPITT